MTAISKFLVQTRSNLNNINYPSGSLAKVLVVSAITGYVIKLTYPLIINQNKTSDNPNNNFQNIECLEDENSKHEIEIEEETILKAQIVIAKQKKSSDPGLNKEFINHLRKLILIMIPSVICRESGILCIHTLCLLSRTFLSIYVAGMEGAIVKYIVKRDFKNFSMMLIKWFGIAIPATFINSMIRYLENKLALEFR